MSRAATPRSVAGGTGVVPSFAVARDPVHEGGHLVGRPVDDMDVELRHVVERGAGLGQRGADVEVAPLDLGGQVAHADGDLSASHETCPAMKTSFEPVAIDTCRYASIFGSPPGFTRVMAMSYASLS